MESHYSTVQPRELNYTTGETLEKALCEIAGNIAQEKPVFLLIHSYDQVQIGTISREDVNLRTPLNPEYLQELRLFSDTGELHIWKKGGNFLNRLRIDKESGVEDEKVYVHTELHAMWGTEVKKHEHNGSWLREDRGTEIWVPFHIKKEEEKTILPLFYGVKNYIKCDPNGIAQCVDARLCGLFDQQKQPFPKEKE